QVSKGAHPNILILRKPWDQKTKKFKTQITVDEIRKTASFLQTASGANAWRIVIVDPADDMNNSAANALLKILEEPPARTIFFVLAHSPRGLLPTIRSRCQVLALKPLPESSLRMVLKAQPLTADISDSEVDHLVHYAKGSAKRALLLHQSGVLQTFSSFLEIVQTKQGDVGQLHRLAGMLAPAAKVSEYNLFMDLIYDHIDSRAHDMAINDQIGLDAIAKWAAIWDKTREATMRAETWNMDKKQAILDLYSDLRAA
ncbi:MAG: DNA polymerase III subunit delta', partial [Salaquimonas sp.]